MFIIHNTCSYIDMYIIIYYITYKMTFLFIEMLPLFCIDCIYCFDWNLILQLDVPSWMVFQNFRVTALPEEHLDRLGGELAISFCRDFIDSIYVRKHKKKHMKIEYIFMFYLCVMFPFRSVLSVALLAKSSLTLPLQLWNACRTLRTLTLRLLRVSVEVSLDNGAVEEGQYSQWRSVLNDRVA